LALEDDPAGGQDRFLRPTAFLDGDHPAVSGFARAKAGGALGPVEKARRLFLAVRDDILYDPYGIEWEAAGFRASRCLERGGGYCVTKAVLLAACARASGIPARLGFADVINHLNAPRLREIMETDLFVWHGYAELRLSGRWIKATPAFNQSLCGKIGVEPVRFDGKHDALMPPTDLDGRSFMEYVRDRGRYDDVPFDAILEDTRAAYPKAFEAPASGKDRS